MALLAKQCRDCHGPDVQEVKGYDVDIRDSLLEVLEGRKEALVVPGKPEESPLYRAVAEDRMPQGPVKLTQEEKDLLRAWIADGAPFPSGPAPVVARTRVGLRRLFELVRGDLHRLSVEDRPFTRYFSLAHLHNDEKLTVVDLSVARAALSKALNGLHWQSEIVLPRLVDQEGVLLAIDLRRLGWDPYERWDRIVAAYPYALRFDRGSPRQDVELRSLAADVYAATGSNQPILRLDWAVATLTQPPLYHDLLGLPSSLAALERQLRVDYAADFRSGRLRRLGMQHSGVSRANRVIDRHPAAFGAYWRSHDFLPPDKNARSDMLRLPLGPPFSGHPFPALAFVPDGGEVIFHLPNGMQGYLIVDQAGARIDVAPQEVVEAPGAGLLTSAVVNGVSCMMCHAQGMKRSYDTSPSAYAVGGDALNLVQRLFVSRLESSALFDKDNARFRSAAAESMAAFVPVAATGDLPEPITAVVRRYFAPVTAERLALELFLDSTALVESFAALPEGARLGLGGLSETAPRRDTFERAPASGGSLSLFQRLSAALDAGTPYKEIVVR